MRVNYQRLDLVVQRRGRRRSATYDDVRRGVLTPPVRTGPNSVAWPEHEIDAINSAVLAGKSVREIQALVVRLVAARVEAA